MALMDHHPLCVITAQFSGFLYNDYYAQLWRPDGRLRPFGPSPVIYVNWRLSNSPPFPPLSSILSSYASPPSLPRLPHPLPPTSFHFLGHSNLLIASSVWNGPAGLHLTDTRLDISSNLASDIVPGWRVRFPLKCLLSTKEEIHLKNIYIW